MPTTKLFTLFAVDVDGNLIDQITDQNISNGLSRSNLGGDGSIYNKHTSINTAQPAFSFATTAIATAFGVAGLTGLKINADALITAFWQKVAEGETRAGATSHIKNVINEGILVPKSITVQNDGDAEIVYDVVPTYDGSNAPITVTLNQSTSGSPSVGELFTNGPIKINGTTIEGVQSITINFGISLYVKGGSGEGRNTFVAIRKIEPTITFTTTDIEVLSTLGLEGTAQGATDSIVYLRKKNKNGLRVADNVGEHISFTIDDGTIEVTNVAANGEAGESLATVLMTPTYDDVNLPLVIATNATIA